MRSGFDLGAGWNLRLEKWHEDPKISLFRGNTFIKVYRELGKRRDDANDAFWKRKIGEIIQSRQKWKALEKNI